MTSPQAPAICPNKGVDLVPDHLCALVITLGLALTQAAGATATTTLTKMTASQVQPPSNGIYQSTGICTPKMMMTDTFIDRTKGILSSLPSPLQRRR
jgi:hypothetical protein